MSQDVDWTQVTTLLDELYSAVDGLEEIFPGRKFTLDGHLVGSIGEVIAAYMFDLDLNPASTMAHDARARDGRNVEIKLTQGKRVAIRHEPEHLIVLHRPMGDPIKVVYNGPGALAWAHPARCKQTDNGRSRSLGCRVSPKRSPNMIACRFCVNHRYEWRTEDKHRKIFPPY